MKFFKNKNFFKVTYEGKEGYVVTTETSTTKDLLWVYRNGDIFQLPDRSRGQHIAMVMRGLEIIASTFPLGDLPQFVVDKIDENIQERNYYKQVLNPVSSWELESQTWEKGFIDGWNKHAEKYKFTEEDIVKCYKGLLQNVGTSVKISDLPTVEEYLKYLQQPKEITEIEFEVYTARFPKDNGWEVLPTGLKITKSSEFPNGLLTVKNVKCKLPIHAKAMR